MHELLLPSTAAFAVSTIFCLWRSYCQIESRRKQQLRQRVAYLLWSAAQRGKMTPLGVPRVSR